MRILVAETLAQEGLELLARSHDVDVRVGLERAELLAALPDYEALVVRSQVQVNAEAIAAGRRLMVIGRAGVGVDNVDVEAATRAGITVVNAPTGNTIAAAEQTIGLMLAAARRIAAADASLRRGEWKRSAFTGLELRGKTLGILGLGRIGLAVADRARGLEMTVVGHDPFVSADLAAAHGIALLEPDEVIARAAVLTVHVPGGRSTRGLIGARELALLPEGAIVLNVARGGIIDEPALSEALRSGHIGAAGIDVFTAEPPRDSPLLDAPRAVLTPHLGASTAEAQVRVAIEASQQVVDVLEGRSARYAVNAPLATPDTAPVVAPYLAVAETLGRLRAQLGPLDGELTLELAGELAEHDGAPLTAAALQGLLEATTDERVNLVNAPSLARARGLTLVERRTADAGRYASLVSLGGGADGAMIVGGTLANGRPRLVRLGEHWLDIAPTEWMLITRHQDRPGTIGRVGTILGEADVNISAMHVARSQPRADAFMILALDDAVDKAVAERIRALEAVLELWLVHLA